MPIHRDFHFQESLLFNKILYQEIIVYLYTKKFICKSKLKLNLKKKT